MQRAFSFKDELESGNVKPEQDDVKSPFYYHAHFQTRDEGILQ
jgi:hypothetical protein